MNKKIKIIYVAATCLLGGYAHAARISGQFNLDGMKDAIRYEYETESGEFSVNLSDAFEPKLTLSKDELKKMDCSRDREQAVKGFARLGIEHFVKTDMDGNKRKPVRFNLEINTQLMNLSKINEKIEADLKSKGIEVRTLKHADVVDAYNLKIDFEWMEDSGTYMAQGELVKYAEHYIRTQLNDFGSMSLIKEEGKTWFDTSLHIFACDLIAKKVNMLITSKFSVRRNMRKEGLFSKKIITKLNQSLLAKQHLLDVGSKSGDYGYLEQYNVKAVNAGALFAFEMQKLGFDENILKEKDALGRLFNGMYFIPEYNVAPLKPHHVDSLYEELLDFDYHKSVDTEFKNKKIKFEVK